jgi:hypothetical protein
MSRQEPEHPSLLDLLFGEEVPEPAPRQQRVERPQRRESPRSDEDIPPEELPKEVRPRSIRAESRSREEVQGRTTRPERGRPPQRTAPQAVNPRNTMRQEILRMLRSGRLLRQAIVLNEIIGPPKALRKPEGK